MAISSAGAQNAPRYHVEVVPPIAAAPSMYPADISETGVVIGVAGSDPFDPLATPIANGRGRTIELRKPTDSLNFVFGIQSPALIVGTSGNFPVAWVRGTPRRLRPARNMPQGAAVDANGGGAICGYVYNDLTGRQFPVAWRHVGAAGYQLPGIGDSRSGGAFAINEMNQIAGAIENVDGFGFVGVRWDDPFSEPAVIVEPLPGAMNSEALAINNLGDMVGRSSFPDFTIEAILYIDATGETRGLGSLEDSGYSVANSINDLRQVVGVSRITSSGMPRTSGFYWAEGELHDLNDRIFSTSEPIEYIANAIAINNEGVIAAEVVVEAQGGHPSRIARLIPVER